MDWSYVAGFFDGEGNIHIASSRTFLNKKYSLHILIRIYQKEEKILEEIRKFINMGSIYGQGRTSLELTITKKEQVKLFLENIKDKVIVKKGQVNYVLKNFDFGRANNIKFDIDKFRSFINRKGVKKYRKLHTQL